MKGSSNKIHKLDPNIISNYEDSTEYADSPSLGHLIVKNLASAGEKVLLISSITAEELTANQLLAKSIAVAQSLKVLDSKYHAFPN